MKNVRYKAFSLIELSIVILIIGILIAGVTQGSNLIAKTRLTNAITLTQSSPVPSIKGLNLWLETTSQNSFNEGQDENDAFFTSTSPWYDINPTAVSKLFALTSSTTGLQYKESEIGGLPSIYFSGGSAADCFTLSSTKDSITAMPIVTKDNAFTMFFVLKKEEISGQKYAFYNGDQGGNNGVGLRYRTDGSKQFLSGITAPFLTNSLASRAKEEILSITYEGGTAGEFILYTNGAVDSFTSGNTVTLNEPQTGFYIGSLNGSHSATWKGYMSEIIVYDKKLKDADRQYVEEYLGQKYSISL